MGFTDVVRKAFPFLSIAATAGGPLTSMAAAAIGRAIGADKTPSPTADAIQNAMATAFADPAQRAAMIKEEHDFQLQMQELGYKNEQEFESIAAADRASARSREIAVRDYTPEVGFYVMTGIFCVALFCLFKFPIPPDNKALIYSGMGTLGALLVAAANYFYGTSRGSERKTELLAQAPPIQSK